ncbi:hypothetical protein, partial [Arenicella sp. 4NH20-0111]|uniref:hypothetical protein n=1 Tax=Arenicella sp. 4NH20-0111 TaxID=3127648 RepID=UPI003342825A
STGKFIMLKKLKSLFSSSIEIEEAEGRPQLIAINHDDYHAEHIGRAEDGSQFFLTTPFEPKFSNKEGCEYLALFKFDSEGNLIDSEVESFGPRGTFNEDKRKARYTELLKKLGKVAYQRIEIKPFSITYNKTEIGLIVREPEDYFYGAF